VQHGVDLGQRPAQRRPVGEIDDAMLEPAFFGDGAKPRGIAAGEQRPQAQGLGLARHELPRIARRAIDHEPASHATSFARPSGGLGIGAAAGRAQILCAGARSSAPRSSAHFPHRALLLQSAETAHALKQGPGFRSRPF